MNKLTIKVCPVCGGTHMEHAMTCIDHYASGEAFHLCRCQSCGFLFTQDFPVEAEIGRYYETPDYISHSDTKKGLMNRVYHWVRSYMLGRKARLVIREAHRKTGCLLDVGTGTGYFAATMKRRGWEVEAVEKNAQARQFAKEHFGLEVKPDTELQRFTEGSFDVITLWHVMEHLEYLNDTWDTLNTLLAERGVLIVAVPNCSSYDAKKYGALWAAYDVPRHLWHFTPATIQRIAAKHGFIWAAHLPMPFDAFYVSMLSEKYMGHSLTFFWGMLSGMRAWLSTLGRKEQSSSMIYVFRKK
ncbi:methyltransferase domain-containing protein [uncultured Bacteroides sp.]|uniref:methyltransferase domain-containing protein n=1 Tax=uncultured Bacteroides sp. TaxID=162156 RepID=UPI0025F99000|nr:methyltransferase domain-containing protein [uncultured Bacteroides sp.]